LPGAGLGAAAIQGLHAQAKPLAYVISEIEITDKERLCEGVRSLAVKALKERPKQLAAGGKTAAILGEPPNRVSFCRF
jgi:hypothetical protein